MTRLPRRQRDGDRARSRISVVIDARDGDRRRGLVVVDQPKLAHLVGVASGVEDRHFVRPRHLRNNIVQRHDQAVRVEAAGVGVDVQVEFARDLQAPVALAVSHPPGQTLVRVAVLQIVGIEMLYVVCGQCEGHRSEPHARVVSGMHGHRARFVRPVDHPREPLLVTVRRRHEQRQQVTRLGRSGLGDEQAAQSQRLEHTCTAPGRQQTSPGRRLPLTDRAGDPSSKS